MQRLKRATPPAHMNTCYAALVQQVQLRDLTRPQALV